MNNNSLNIHFNGFRSGDSKITGLLQLFSKIFECNCVRGNLYDSEMLCESVYSPSVLKCGRDWQRTFLYSGCNRRVNEFTDEYDAILYDDECTKICNIISLFEEYDRDPSNKRSFIPANNGILAITTCMPTREQISILDKISKCGIKIVYPGLFRNNVGYILDFNGLRDHMVRYMHNFKFVIVFNDLDLQTALEANVVPIPVLVGSCSSGEDKYLSIKCDDEVDNLMALINNLSVNNNKWLEFVNKPPFDVMCIDVYVDSIKNCLENKNKSVSTIKSMRKSIFDHIDAIFYINLASRPDRREHFLSEIVKLTDDMSRVHLVDAVAVKENGALGCTRSHIKTFEMIEANPEWKNCIIFEDDFTFRLQTIKENNEYLCRFFENSEYSGWDVLSLSFNPWRVSCKDTVDINVKKVFSTQTTSGYCISRKFVPIIKANFMEAAENMLANGNTQYNCCDIYWKRLQPNANWYLLSPSVGYQYDNFSDIEQRVTAYGC